MVLLFYVDYCLMFSPYKDKLDEFYASLQEYFKIEDDVELNKYPEIDLEHHLDGSIHISQPYLTQRTLVIPVMYKSSDKPTPAVKPPLAKNEGAQERKNNLITDN